MLLVLTGLDQEANCIPMPHEGLIVYCGAAAANDLDALITPDITGLVAFGIAGSLSPLLKVGELAVLSAVNTGTGDSYTTDQAWSDRLCLQLPGAARVHGFSDRSAIATTAAEKSYFRELTRGSIQTVDMIAWAVAEAAAKHKLPFVVIQAISDSNTESIPTIDVTDTEPNGSPNVGALVEGLIADPAELGGTIEVAETSEKAFAALRSAFAAVRPAFLWK